MDGFFDTPAGMNEGDELETHLSGIARRAEHLKRMGVVLSYEYAKEDDCECLYCGYPFHGEHAHFTEVGQAFCGIRCAEMFFATQQKHKEIPL